MAEVNLQQAETKPPAVTERAAVADGNESVFSVRFLLGVLAVYAAAFALVGSLGKNWSPRQMYVCTCLLIGWGALTGLGVYALLSWRQERQAQLGKLLFHSQGGIEAGVHPANFLSYEAALLYITAWAPGIMAVVLFLLWCAGAIAFVQSFDWESGNLSDSIWNLPLKAWVQGLSLWALQTCALSLFIGQPNSALEIRSRGMIIRGVGKLSWHRIKATHWAADASQQLICRYTLPGGGGQVDRIYVPAEERKTVDQLLTSCLGERHTGE